MKRTIIRMLLKSFFWLHAFSYKAISSLAIAYEHGLHPKHRILGYHRFFLDRIVEGDRVIDVGCGNGALAHDLASKASFVKGVDISEKNIEKARRANSGTNIEFAVADATKDLGNERFDVLVLSNVLEHIEHRIEFLRSIRSISPKFLIRVPLLNRDWVVVFKKELGSEWRLDMTHFTEFTPEQFKEEIEAAGYAMGDFSVQWGELWTEIRPNGRE